VVNLSLDSPDGLIAQNVMLASAVHGGSNATRVVLAGDAKPGEAPNFAMVSDLDFTDGTIEVEVAGLTLPDGPPQARGFIGFVFRIAEDFIGFEGLYIRPTNGRADDQLRRNHAVQYFSYPDYGWKRLRDEAPGQYETYADMVPGEWTKLRAEISGEKARLFIHNAEQPALLVNDMKLGPRAHGTVGLWIGTGTEGFFRNLRITQ
jgi:hypothetical protein